MGYYHPNVKMTSRTVYSDHIILILKADCAYIVWPKLSSYRNSGPMLPLLPTLLPGKRVLLNIGGCCSRPLHSTPTCQRTALLKSSTVGGMVVIKWRVRCQADPGLPRGPPAHSLGSLVGGEEVPREASGLCPKGFSPGQGCLLDWPSPRGGEPPPHPCLCGLMAAAVCKGSELTVPSPQLLGGMRSLKASWALGAWLLSNDSQTGSSWDLFLLARTGPQRVESYAWGFEIFCHNRE